MISENQWLRRIEFCALRSELTRYRFAGIQAPDCKAGRVVQDRTFASFDSFARFFSGVIFSRRIRRKRRSDRGTEFGICVHSFGVGQLARERSEERVITTSYTKHTK
jgi:hypothetical protein